MKTVFRIFLKSIENKLEQFSGGWKKVQFQTQSWKKCLLYSKMAGKRSDFIQKGWNSFF